MTPIPKKYLHDKLILLLVSGNIFLSFLCAVLIFLRLNIGQGSDGYIVQYRSNLGISAFKTGSITELLSFACFALLIAAIGIILSIRTYPIRRELSVAVLSSGALLLLLAIIVSNALMVLH
ncbi:MAG TPA: hypothetical protein VLI54_02040 [Bacillota bacterium]|nr:hypothetical protein [Bacillota bacterium]HSX36544.1 hypothetical protein [Patescibacteria group bacterium]